MGNNIVSMIRKIPRKFINNKVDRNANSPIIIKRARVLNEKSPFHVKEAYKALRTNVVFSIPHEGTKKVIVTSALAGEGKSTNCLNLAISFAQTGSKVVIIDADLRKPNIARLLDIDTTPGLSNVLVSMNTLESVIKKSGFDNLDVIPSGDLPPNPSELLGSEKMKSILDSLAEKYEYIFIDTTPINIVTDAVVVSKIVDGVLIVVRQGRTDKENVAEAIEKFEFTGANVLGFILNGRMTDTKYGYKYRYKYRRNRQYKYSKYGKYDYYGTDEPYGYGYGYGYGKGYGYDSADKKRIGKDTKEENK